MFSRIGLFACLIAALAAVADPAFARPRRRGVVQYQPVRPESKPAASEAMKQVMYPVADLIVPIESRPNLDVDPLPGPRTAKITPVESPEVEVPPVAVRSDDAELPTPRSCNASSQKRAEASPLPMAIGDGRLPKLLPGQTTEALLMDLIKNTVAAESWVEQGGQGTCQYYPLGMSLVVNQTPAVHEEVRSLLAALRRMQDVEAAVEVRIVTASPEAFEKACKEMNFKRVDEKDNPFPEGKRTIAPKGKRWTTFIDNDQVRQMLALLQEDGATTVMQAPKITAFNGQNIALNCTEDRFLMTSLEIAVGQSSEEAFFVPTQSPWVTGMSLGLQSVVSADRQHVRVQLKGYWSQLAGPVSLQPVQMPIKSKNERGKIETTVFQMFLQMPTFAQVKLDEQLTIPDGGVALISCGVVPMEVERDDLVAQVFRFCGCDAKTTTADRHVFFLISPRVIINEEEEAPPALSAPSISRP